MSLAWKSPPEGHSTQWYEQIVRRGQGDGPVGQCASDQRQGTCWEVQLCRELPEIAEGIIAELPEQIG